ncbi:MAG: hypothetical protein JNN01_03620 [Opitutaceae bacterium]|nr:hypothetical protein [Opitutaceae bacterium]
MKPSCRKSTREKVTGKSLRPRGCAADLVLAGHPVPLGTVRLGPWGSSGRVDLAVAMQTR